jgi:hypothetical protein
LPVLFVSWRYSFLVSAQRPALITAVFIVFLRPSTEMLRNYPKLGHGIFFALSFPVHYSLVILLFDAV